ncbi:MAG TPA: PEGA domain-containing protein [Spirochaetota bacterium]|nr:PEGA domain-containing protein [Spirochaetota bacterium]
MKRKCLVTIIIAAVLGSAGLAFTQSDKIRIAVSGFDDAVTSAAEQERAGSSAAGGIQHAFTSNERFFVRQSGAVRSYIALLEKAQLGLINASAVKGMSKNLQVDYLAVGTVSRFGSGYEVDTRVVNVNDWTIVFSHGVTKATLGDAVEDIKWYIDNKLTREYCGERLQGVAEQPVLSVYRFDDHDSKTARAGYSGAFAEILNSELGSYVLVKTVERKFSKALVDEKILEMAGVIENDNANASFCTNGVQYKLAGDVRSFDDIVCINYRLYNTADNRIVFLGTREIGSAAALRPAARSLACTIEDVLTNRVGTIKIDTIPSGADISIDGMPSGTTPVTLSLAKGNHTVLAKLDGYESAEKKVVVSPRDVTAEIISLVMLDTTLMQKAFQLEQQGKWKEASGAYDEFVQKFKNNQESNIALYRKGHVAMIYLRNYKSAVETFNELIRRYPDAMTRAEAYYGLILAFKAMGNIEQARKNYSYLMEKYGETSAAERARGVQL